MAKVAEAAKVPLTINGYVRMGAQFSGGTFHSAINAFARGRQTVAAARQRRQVEQRPAGRKVHSASPRLRRDSKRVYGRWPSRPSTGQVTPAQAMGDALLSRLQGAGIDFRVIEPASLTPTATRRPWRQSARG